MNSSLASPSRFPGRGWFLAVLLLAAACRAAGSDASSSAPLVVPEPAGATADAPASATAGSHEIPDPYYQGLGNGGYDVQHYDLVLDVDLESGVIEAVCRITARATQDLARFHLDLYGLDVDQVLVRDEEASFEREGRELIVRPERFLPAGEEFTVAVRYGGVPEPAPDPGVPFVPGVGWFRTPSGVYVVSECSGAASWFPCNDHPLDKATYSIEVTVPKPYTVASNGILVEERDAGDRRTWLWRASDPMSTYLATVCIAEFDVVVEEGPGGIPMRTYLPTDATEEERAVFARTNEILAFFGERFGPYPFESVGAVLSYENLGGALETQTIPVYGRGADESTVAHELAHQWFGDCVGPANWQELWLNEGFASYAEQLWFEHTEGAEAALERGRGMYRMLRAANVGPPADPGLEQLFGASVYVRGPLVLQALRDAVGDETFFAILRAWVDRNHDGHGTTDAFVALCEESTEADLSLFFALLYDADMPVVPSLE